MRQFRALTERRSTTTARPFLEAAVDSERLTLKYGDMRRVLDFRSLTVTDSDAG